MSLHLSGERFCATYRLASPQPEALARALCVEQTVEFPADLLPPGPIPEQIVGQIVALVELAPGVHQATLSYAVETAGAELTQLLNLLLGNASLLPGVRLQRFDPSPALLAHYAGPRFGRQGIRALLQAPTRPLLCTALKPMGLDPSALARLAYTLALGGVDLIKDDHGLADQPFCPFEQRVARCAEAVAQANAHSGGHTRYLPNLSAPAHLLMSRAHFAAEAGAGGFLLAPGLVGFDALRAVADDDSLALPILSHPALQGSFLVHPDHGISQLALFGQLHRLAGADAVIFPHHGGRFAFSQADCQALATSTGAPLGALRPVFPVPAGGMRLDRIPELRAFYGDDVIFLIGGDLHRGDLRSRCEAFRAMAEDACPTGPSLD